MTAASSRNRLLGCAAVLLGALVAVHVGAQSMAEPPGESIYRDGILPSGEPVTAVREPDLPVSAADAACTNCHRRSGFGDIEGRIRIPAVTGAYLFSPREHERDARRLPFDTAHSARDAYTNETLARAIREGVAPDGHKLNYLMPHYALSDADMAALIQYLKVMTPVKSPGVDGAVLHFATIVTPDADPVRRRGMLDVLEHYFADKGTAARAGSPDLHPSQGALIKSHRRWQLHVWELNGPPTTWEEQLRTRLAREPVFAAISGLGAKTWAPIHRFCEQAALPCLFPNVDLPEVVEHDFYSLYFSRGVLLEADLMARRVMDAKPNLRRVVQIFRQDDIGSPAAKALSAAIAGVELVDRPLKEGNIKPQLAAALRGIDYRDVLVLWLRPQDVAALAAQPAPKSQVLISSLMGGLGSAPVPAAWRSVTTMAYPFDLPDQRVIRTDYPLGWFRIKQIPVIEERVQTDTWLACNFLSEALDHMSNTLVRDYLVDALEGMLEHLLLTGYYPRMTMAPHQRFGSKGGYLVKFAQPDGARLTAVSDWIVP